MMVNPTKREKECYDIVTPFSVKWLNLYCNMQNNRQR